MKAARNGKTDEVKSILEKEATETPNAETLDGRSRALYLAAEGNHVACMEELKKAGANVNYAGYNGKQEIHTPLMRAAYFGHREAIKWLMEDPSQEAGIEPDGSPNPTMKKAMGIAVTGLYSWTDQAEEELNAWMTDQRRLRSLPRVSGEL